MMNNQLMLTCLSVVFVFGCSSSGGVVVRSEPGAADVYVLDAKTGRAALIGKTPLSFVRSSHATEGSDVIQLRVEKEGFQAKTPAVAAFGGGTTYLDIDLTPVSVAQSEVRDSFERARTHMSSVHRLVQANRYAEALVEVEQVLTLDPRNAEAHAAKGSVLYLMRDTQGAQTSWSKALELSPGMDSVRSALIDLNMDKKNRLPASIKGESKQ